MTRLFLAISFLFTLNACGPQDRKSPSELKTAEENLDSQETSLHLSKEIESAEVLMLDYLTTHFKQNKDSTFLKNPDWMIAENSDDTTCGYIISFKEGHTFKHEQKCVEWGEVVTVTFVGFETEEVRKIVTGLFRNDHYNWYNNATEYRPEEYYESLWTFYITEIQEGIELRFAYSWI